MIDADYDIARDVLDDLVHWRRDLASGRCSAVLARVLGDGALAEPADADQIARRLYYGGHAEDLLREALVMLDRAEARAAGSARVVEIAALRRRCEAARADIAEIVARNRACASARPALAIPAASGDAWADLSRDAAAYVVRQWRAGFGELVHQNQFSAELSREIATGDVFQRALVADALCDLPSPWPAALSPLLDAELAYLHAARTCSVRGWSYYPGFAELPPDADLLAQIIQVTLRLRRRDLVPGFEEPIRQALHVGSIGDGSFATWLLPPPAERSPLHRLQAALVGPPSADAEVVANLVYALALLDRQRFVVEITDAARWLVEQQRTIGDWTATWYLGTAYSTYVCVRALAELGVAPEALAIANHRLIATQRSDGGWGRDGEPTSNALDTALAMLTIAAIAPEAVRPVLERARSYLAAMSPDGWPAVPFIQQGSADPRPFASRIVTAAYVVKAAARCRP